MFPWKIELHDYDDPYMDERRKRGTEMNKYNEGNSEESGCTQKMSTWLDAKDPRLNVERTATVLFDNNAYGEAVINYLLPMVPRWDTFSLSGKDKQGVISFFLLTTCVLLGTF